ncbi:putative integral membrane protein [Streptomyces davaonensis JCM 4913]|uniref:Putative integral membrane protein n=1 Tax=Streptomyces davaonensis (strain DSM 101723 / JCM 4913 / KCC S-0913 / 768) TaxID=1214101 RepID=K4R7S4_STRDJ|nr:hypothetical protein [Streptomyces davaonensis]CCK29130.1 putative integral membrane protein [Streptomyces davaonensis JCM 4913]
MSLGDQHEPSGGYGGTGHTRTRLPEGSGDTYGGARRPTRSSSRSLITVVGVVVLLIAAIAFANRGGDDSSPDDTAADKPQTSSTAPSGERPVGAGYARDEQGAQSAAANYAVTLVSADMLKPARRSEIVRQVFLAEKQGELEDKFNAAYSEEFLSNLGLDENGNATGSNTYVSRTMPIGTKVTTYSDSAATVEVWCTGVFGTAGEGSTDPVSSDWFTMTLKLRWADDWKVESFAQKDGPSPVPGDNKASSADEMAKAVEEYGGFTYAR